jgi:hypothetical protein
MNGEQSEKANLGGDLGDVACLFSNHENSTVLWAFAWFEFYDEMICRRLRTLCPKPLPRELAGELCAIAHTCAQLGTTPLSSNQLPSKAIIRLKASASKPCQLS